MRTCKAVIVCCCAAMIASSAARVAVAGWKGLFITSQNVPAASPDRFASLNRYQAGRTMEKGPGAVVQWSYS
jgi:iron only hydrogenase large subunit-like protein